MNSQARFQILYVILFSLAVGLCVSFSSYYDLISSDAIIVYLAGLMRWTPFYWAQDRYGMLIPALTQWITDPVHHIIAQNTLHIMTSMASFFLLARYLFPGPRWMETGLLAILFFAAISSAGDIKPFLSPWQIYTPALMFGLGALLVLPHSMVLAALFLVIAQWCNFSVVLLLGMLVVSRAAEASGRLGFQKVRKGFALEILLLGLTSVISFFIRKPHSQPSSGYSMLEWQEALTGWLNILKDYYSTGSTLWLFAIPAGLGAAAMAYSYRNLNQHRDTLRSFVLAQFVLISYAMVVGASVFAKWNGYPRRYLIPSLMIWCVAWSALTLNLWPKWERIGANFRWAGGLAAILTVVIFRFGAPSLTAVHQSLDERFAKTFSQVDETCTHVAGDYYRVWDTVFYSKLKNEKQLWGITGRAQVIRDLWEIDDYENPRICYWKDNKEQALKMLKDFGYEETFTTVAGTETMGILTKPLTTADTL